MAAGCFLLFITCSPVLYAQQIHFEHLSIDNGLSQNAVNSILQDKDGFLWFATKDGLNRYDGYTFKIFHNVPFDSTTISSDAISTLLEDTHGNLWIGASDGKLDVYQKQTNTFQHIRYRSGKPGRRSIAPITAMAEDSNGNMWIGTGGDGLYELIVSNEQTFPQEIVHFIHNTVSLHSLSSNNIHTIYTDSSKQLWIGTEQDLLKFNKREKNFTRYKIPATASQYPSSEGDSGILAIQEFKQGLLWLGTPNGMVLFYEHSGKSVSYPDHQHEITQIVKDHEDKLWLATPGPLLRFNPLIKAYESFKNNPFDPYSLSDNSISSLYCDRSGILWIGTSGEGIDIFNPRKNQFHTLIRKKNEDSRSSAFSIRSIFEDTQGFVWISTDFLYRWNPVNGQWKSYETDPNRFEEFGNSVVYSMIQSGNGDILFGTGVGLFDYNPRSGKARLFKYDPSDSTELPQQPVTGLFKDRHGHIWVTTINYLCELIDIKKEISRSYLYNSTQNELFRPHVYLDKDGSFWISSREGLLHFDKKTGNIQRYEHDPDNPQSLDNNFIKSLCPDPKQPDKFLWIGTSGGGLNKFNIAKKTFSHFTTKDGLPNNVVYGILPDKRGNLWLSTNKGLSRFNPDSLTFRNYDVSDGLQSNEFNTGAYFESKSGEMFFGGIKGLNHFYPDNIKDNTFVPPVVITKYEVQKQSPSDDNNPVSLRNIYDKKESMILPYNENIISFSFASLDFSAPEKNQFAYKLEHFDKEWIDAGTNHTAAYTNLSPGEYAFLVKGTNSDGVWNEKGDSLRFVILPPWWKTWWAYSIYGILFLAILFLIRRYELNRIKLKNQLQIEKFESDSLRHLDQLKSRFFTNISHEFRTPLTLILGQINSVLSSNIEVKEKSKLQVADRNANRLLTLINQLLDIAKIEAGSMELRAEPHNIVSFLKSLFYSFESIAESKKIGLKFVSEYENIPVVYDPDKMEKIFYNLISNALKFTPDGGEIIVTSGISGSSAEIRIKDTGIGIPEDRHKNIFNRFYQVDNSSTRAYEGTGIGLTFTKDLIELHKGNITVNSKIGEGSEFVITLPLGEENPEQEQITEDTALLPGDIETNDRNGAPGNQNESRGEEKILLVVEDNADIRAYIREQIKPDHKVLEASNGKEGILKARDEIPDLIITDVMMPEMDGYEFCKGIRNDEKTSHIPIIMLTAKAGLDDKIEGLETGADAWLTKPFSSRELSVRIKNLIHQREQLRKRFSKSTIIKPSEVSAVSADQNFLQKVIRCIEGNFENSIFGTEELAGGVNMSVSQLNRKLNALIDQPSGQLIRSLRLQRAADLIKQNSGNIAEISYKVGFTDQAYFTRAFKKQFGCTPSEYE